MAGGAAPFPSPTGSPAEQQLEADARWAASMVASLVRDGALAAPILRAARGLLFARSTRTALGLGYQSGRALALARGPDGVWSAPLPQTITRISLGVSYGYAQVDSLLLLATDAEAASLAHGAPAFGTEARFATADESAEVDAGSDAAPLGPDGRLPASRLLSVVREGSVLVDVSVVGGAMLVDADAVASLYGPSTAPEDVLGGRTPVPGAAAGLYAALDAAARA